MKQYINHRHISLVLALFILYLAITYWEVVAKFIQTIFSATMPLLIGGIVAYIVNLLLRQYEYLYSHLFKKRDLVFVNIRQKLIGQYRLLKQWLQGCTLFYFSFTHLQFIIVKI